MTTHEALRTLAEKATPGPWEADEEIVHRKGDIRPSISLYAKTGRIVGSAEYWDGEDGHDNAAYIAAASPSVVLALLDDNERMREALEEIYALASSFEPVLKRICPAGCLPTRGQEEMASILAKPFHVAKTALSPRGAG